MNKYQPYHHSVPSRTLTVLKISWQSDYSSDHCNQILSNTASMTEKHFPTV